MGEVVHGDYRHWANADTLDTVSNYEQYRARHSSHNSRNYSEGAYALNRQSGEERGVDRDLALATFADNHDLDRIAGRLADPAHLYPLYALLLTVPSVPSIYYGSEWGIDGRRAPATDAPLRPVLDPAGLHRNAPLPALRHAIQRLIRLRRAHPALRRGSYQQLSVAHQQLAFLRATDEQRIVVAVNAAGEAVHLRLALPSGARGRLVDILDGGDMIPITDGCAAIRIYPHWARVFRWLDKSER